MIFNWMKLGLAAVTLFLSLILLAICAGIGYLTSTKDNALGMLIMLGLWASGTKAINFLLMHYFGYIVKAGHVAIISKAVTTGEIPNDQFSEAKKMVSERFITSNVFFALDKLVDGAVRQLSRTFERMMSFMNIKAIPGAETVIKIVKLFIGIAFGYVDECCLGYTFYKKEQTPFKSATDAVVIYFQNWKALLKNAAFTTILVVVSTLLITIVTGVFFALVFRMVGLHPLFGFGLGYMIALAIKFAFIDSWILVSMMTTYMQLAPTTELAFDLYGKLCGLSSKFKELYDKGRQESPNPAAPQPDQMGSDGLPPMEGGIV
jgi:hypothetical protein